MLATQPKKSIVVKVFETESGELIRATFLVTESHGRVRGRLLSTAIISAAAPHLEKKVFALPAPQNPQVQNYSYTPAFQNIESPYFDFSFMTSQPTRAPSF